MLQMNSKTKSEKSIRWGKVFVTGSAFMGYQVGAGSSSGAESLQFFASYGASWGIISMILLWVLTLAYTYGTYNSSRFLDNARNAYKFFCGKYFAPVVDWFSMILLTGITLVLFAGCGAALNQYLGIPEYVGAISIGLISLGTVMLGLERLVDIIGNIGFLTIGILLVVALFQMVTADESIFEASANMTDYVKDGSVLQAGLFGIDNEWVSFFSYIGINICTGFPLLAMVGNSIVKSKPESIAMAFSSSTAFMVPIVGTLVLVLYNIDYVVETSAQIPVMAAIERLLPPLAIVFLIVVVLEIYTSIAGYLFVVGRRLADDKTKRQKIIFVIVTIAGIGLGSFIPFATAMNFVYPMAGLVGPAFLVIVIVKAIRFKEPAEGEIIEVE